MESKRKILIAVSTLVAVLAALYWYLRPPRLATPSGNLSGTQAPGVNAPVAGAQDLGSVLYEKATNPIQDKLPQTVSPVPNPLDGVYKNPFE